MNNVVNVERSKCNTDNPKSKNINNLGFTQEGLDLALILREKYQKKQPLIVPDDDRKLLMPEHLLNKDIDLQVLEDPLPLAMVATRDPDSPMSVSAAVRMSVMSERTPLVTEVFSMLGQTSKHPVVKQCVGLVTESAFNPKIIDKVHNNAKQFVSLSRKRYTEALKENLRQLIDGSLSPRTFVAEFFELSEAGNLRVDIRKRLILGLLNSDTIRPSIKFLFLENLELLQPEVQIDIINETMNAPDKPSLEAIKQELAWIRLGMPSMSAH
jgi:hypothetical protein